MLGEPTVVEQRYLAVREVLDSGASVSSVATRYGVDRRTLHRWLIRYANEGLSVLPTAAASRIAARTRSSRRWRR
jgi:transposase-like protein